MEESIKKQQQHADAKTFYKEQKNALLWEGNIILQRATRWNVHQH